MNKNVLIVAGVVLALFLALPILAKLKTGAESGGAAVESGAAPDAAAAPLLPPSLNAGNLAGSAWNVKGITVHQRLVDGQPAQRVQ